MSEENGAFFDPKDLLVDTVSHRVGSGGFAPLDAAGVRVTHKPSGISVEEKSHRSQHANRQTALEKLELLVKAAQQKPMTAGAGQVDVAIKDAAVEARAAIETLKFLGYTFHGAERWKPPIGAMPEWLSAPQQEVLEALTAALAALKTCKAGGHVDVDGDYQRTKSFDDDAVGAAIVKICAALYPEPQPAHGLGKGVGYERH